MKRIYLDYNATTPVDPEVLEAMMPYFSEQYGNASSVHGWGRQARHAVENARATVAAFIGADPEEILFTSGGTESNNYAIRGIAEAQPFTHVITSSIEHLAVQGPVHLLEKNGLHVTYLPVDGAGIIRMDALGKALEKGPALVSIMLANNEVGTIQPMQEIIERAHDAESIVHTDAIQAAGKMPIQVHEMKVDALSFSAHKLYGPKGIGALYVRRGTRIASLIRGGHQEDNRRAGTENVPAIIGFGKACALLSQRLTVESIRLHHIRVQLEEYLHERLPNAIVHGHPTNRLCNTINISLPSVDNELLVMKMDMNGIAIATGSACLAKSREPSHVLKAMGRTDQDALSCIRLSLGKYTDIGDVDLVVNCLMEAVHQLEGTL